MSKKSSKIVVRGTKEGKLYINPDELFSLQSVQDLLHKVSKSKALKKAIKVSLHK